MHSTAITISHMDPSSQEGEEAEASAPLNPHSDIEASRRSSPSCWYQFRKPFLAILMGGLLFGAGTALSLLYFTQVGNVPYLLGPLFLSVGLMFLVTGLVWVPVVKQSLEHKALTKVSHSKGFHVEHQRH